MSASPLRGAAALHKAPDLEQLAQAICGARGSLADDEARVALGLYRLLAQGEPVSERALAETLALPEQGVHRALRQRPEVIRDEQGRIVGFGGLSLLETPHRFEVDSRPLYAWCAWDTLFLPELLDRVAEVRSWCPVSGDPILLTVEPRSVSRVAPSSTIVSMLVPRGTLGEDVIASFCCHVRYFSSADAGAQWFLEHGGTFPLSVAEAFELGRLANRITFKQVLD